MEVGLSLGSNTGNRLRNLSAARRMLLQIPGVRQVARSSVYETEPVSVPQQFAGLDFLNAMLILETSLAPGRLAAETAAIERRLGRKRGHARNTPRTLDIDVIYAGRLRGRYGRLVLPHPRCSERRFVIEPLAEIRPNLRLPGRRLTVAELLQRLPARPCVKRLRASW